MCHLIGFRLGWLSLVDHLTPIQLCLLMWVSYFIQFRLFWLSLACYSIWCQLVLADNLFYSYYWFLLAALHSFSQQPLLHTSRGTPCPPSWLKPSLFQMKHQHTTLRFSQTRFPIESALNSKPVTTKRSLAPLPNFDSSLLAAELI